MTAQEIRTKEVHEEKASFEALSKIVNLLEPLPVKSQARIIRTLVVFFKLLPVGFHDPEARPIHKMNE